MGVLRALWPLSFFVNRWLVIEGFVRSFVLVFPCVAVRGIVVRLFSLYVGVCVWHVPLSFCRSVVVLLCSFGLRCPSVPRRARYAFSIIVFVLSLRWHFVLLSRADESFATHVDRFVREYHVVFVR